MPEVFVQSFTHLKDMPRAATALDMLKKIASLVKPIMRKHRWVLPVLSEFFPDNPNLLGLNVNGGQKILLRLRYAGSLDAFLPQEEVIGTMLHELTHNVHGPHDDKFYKYLASLQDEFDDLQRSGYAGEGFYSEGRRVGGNVSHNVPQHVARSKAVEAAEKRRQVSRLLDGGGQKLGGVGRHHALTPRELAARAAERRVKDDKSCASGASGQKEAEKAAKASIESKVIDLSQDDLDIPLDIPVAGSSSDFTVLNNPQPSSQSSQSSSNSIETATSKPANLWSCAQCTLLNSLSASQCSLCEASRPLDGAPVRKRYAPTTPALPKVTTLAKRRIDRSKVASQADWICTSCTLSNPHDFWSCAACETIKVQS